MYKAHFKVTFYNIQVGHAPANQVSSNDWRPAGVLKPRSCLISVRDAQQEAAGTEALCESLKRLNVISCISADLPPREPKKTKY